MVVTDGTDANDDFTSVMPPPAVVQTLTNSTEANRATQSAFNAMLRTPFLEEICVTSPDAQSSEKKKPILPIVTEGMTNLAASQAVDLNIVRKLIGFADTLPLLVAGLPKGRLAQAMNSMVTRYVQFAKEKATQSKKFYSSFAQSLDRISETIDAMDKDMDGLREKVAAMEAEIEQASAQTFDLNRFFVSLAKHLGKYLSLQNDSKEHYISALASLFSVSFEAMMKLVYGSGELADLQRSLEMVERLQTRLRDVRLLFTSLHDNLTKVMKSSISLTSVWIEISKSLQDLQNTETPDEKFSAAEVATIKGAWGHLKTEAELYTNAISDVSSGTIGSVVKTNSEIVQRSLLFTEKVSRSIAIVPRGESNVDIVAPQITVDKKTAESLKAMTATSGKIVASFNKLLKVPYLDALKVSAAATSGTGADGSGGDTDASSEVDLETLTLNYLKRYQKLQADTVPIARNLYAYAQLQQNLIPMLAQSLSVSNYVRANLHIIEKRQKDAENVHKLHNKFQQDWNTAILLVERAISEQKENIKGIKNTIKDLAKQKKDMIIGAVFATIGAALFTAAAFATGGLFALLFGSLAVGAGVTAGFLIKNAVELQKSIDAYKSMLSSAETTLNQLENVLPIMLEIQKHLSSVTLIWNDIANKLSALHTGTEAWEALAFILQGDEWDDLKDTALANWKSISSLVLDYVAQVSDVNPEVST